MAEDDRATRQVVGTQILSYVLGELDPKSQESLEQRIETDASLRAELDEVRAHVQMHQEVRKVAPRRGSYDRLRGRMKSEGSFSGAVPGVHCILRRSFMISVAAGAVIVGLLWAFTEAAIPPPPENVIGQIIFQEPAVGETDAPGAEFARMELVIDKEVLEQAYDAAIWLPTGASNAYSTIQVRQKSAFVFTGARAVTLKSGFFRQLDIMPGVIQNRSFVVSTPHCTIKVDHRAGFSVRISPDGAETQISVASGWVKVRGLDAEEHVRVKMGYCTSVRRDSLPNPARPMLHISLEEVAGDEYEFKVVLRNNGFVPVRIMRVLSRDPVYLLNISQAPDREGGMREGGFIEAIKLVPKLGGGEAADDHRGEAWLRPTYSYSFRVDLSDEFILAPKVAHWLGVSYVGDVYGPPGEARVRVRSKPLKLDLRNR